MAVKSTSCPLGILIRVKVQHDQRDLAPVGTFRIGIQHPQVRDGVLMVVRREGALGRSNVGNVRVEGGGRCMGLSRSRKRL